MMRLGASIRAPIDERFAAALPNAQPESFGEEHEHGAKSPMAVMVTSTAARRSRTCLRVTPAASKLPRRGREWQEHRLDARLDHLALRLAGGSVR